MPGRDKVRASRVDSIAWISSYVLVATLYASEIVGQNTRPDRPSVTGDSTTRDDTALTPAKVDVDPSAGDQEIASRLTRILDATGWFSDVDIHVDEGVVFLSGTATSVERRDWASNLAGRTQDVVAVVNHLTLEQPPLWNLQPATDGLRDLWHDTIAFLPLLLFSVVILLMTCLAAWSAVIGIRRSLKSHISSHLLRNVLARAVGFGVLLLGVYVVLRVSGLTRLALTVVGGTGILGLVIGIAFRDITENFLASILLSVRRPFLSGDLVEIVNILGYVRSLTTRATVLITLDGNHVEIPNSVVYKNTIRNFSTNRNRREDFTVGIDYDEAIAEAQKVALRVLRDHPAVLDDPEPWALVDRLGSAAVVLKVYFWLDGSKHSWLKVRSSVIRLIKRAFQDHGINMPDEAREVIFPRGVPVQLSKDGNAAPAGTSQHRNTGRPLTTLPDEKASTVAEGGLESDADKIEQQATQSRELYRENLLSAQGPDPVD